MSVVLTGTEKAAWSADLGSLCPNYKGALAFDQAGDAAGQNKGYIQLRSVEGIIYFLGEAVRPCVLDPSRSDCGIRYVKEGEGTRDLFRIWVSDRRPSGAAIATTFHDRAFSVSRLDREDLDRSLKTLSFLSQLVALQTAPIPLSPTLITLP